MRIFLYILLGLVVLLVAAVLVGPSLIDWNAQKDRIAGEVRSFTGRELKIDGDMEFAVLPAPALLADGVRFANIDGGSAPFMIELEALQVKIKLLPLIQGRIEIESVSLVEPKIFLEVLPDGRKNWDFQATNGAEPETAVAPEEDGFARQVAIESFTIADGTLVYQDEERGVREQLHKVDLRFVAESLNGPFSAAGTADWRDIALSFDAAVGRVVRDGAMPLKVMLGLPAAKAESQFSGTLSLHRDGLSLRGRLGATGANLAAAAMALAPNDPDLDLPGSFAQPFEIAANLSGDAKELAIEELRLKLGEIKLTGQSTLRPGPPMNVNLTLNATRIDLDAFLAAGQSPGQSPGPPPVPGQAGGPALGQLVLPADLSGRAELVVEGLVYRGQALRQLRLDASLAARKLTIGEARALLPGGSSLSMTGKLETPESGPQFDGRGELGSDNLRALLTWAGLDVSSVPAERLRRMGLKTLISATPKQASLSDLDLTVDLSRITGGVVAALRERPGLGIGLTIDAINLDAYLPAPPDPGSPRAGLELTALDRFDANLDLRIGTLTAEGITGKDLHLDATLDDGVLTLRKASAGDLAGGQARLAGTLSSLTGSPAFDGSLDLRIKDPLRLAKVTGLDDEVLARLGPFGLVTSLRGTAEQLAVDAQLTALEGRFGFVGSLAPSASPPNFDLEVALRHPDLAALLSALELPLGEQGQLGALDLTGRTAGDSTRVQVSQLSGNAGPLGLAGGFGADLATASPAVQDLALDLSLRHDDTAQLLAALGQPGLVSPDLGATQLSGRLTGSDRALSLGALSGQVGPVAVNGSLTADLSAARPALSVSLATGELPLALLGATAGDGEETDKSAPRWSPQPLDLDGLRAFDGTLELTSTALVDGAFRLEDAKLTARLEDGLLTLDKLTGGLHQGALQAVGKLDARSTPEFGLALTVIGLELGAYLPAHGGTDRINGPIDLDLELSSRGDSEAALVGALRGKGKLNGTVTFESTSAEGLGAMTLKFLGNRFKQVTNLAGLTTSIYDTFAGEPARLSGTYEIERGVVTTDDTSLDNSKGVARLTGQASLPLWQQDTEVKIHSKKGLTRPLMTLTLKGPLDDPNVTLSGVSSGHLNNIVNPSPGDTAEPAPDAPPKVPGQDLIKNILEGLQP